jgi:hypothetical protein
MLGELKKLKIEAFKEIDYQTKADEFIVMFNPASYSQKYEVDYEESQGQGTTGSTQKFGKIKPQEYSFEFIFDGTGASSEKKDVTDEIERFLKVTGKIDSDIHRPFYLQISWGSLISRCVLRSADITYNLFKPDGYPLRAKVNATFAENIDDELRTAEEGKNSPDLTHYRVVKEGDTLPIMTYRIYGDLSYYVDVAKINKLDNFKRLEAGTRLRFPPLKQQKSS